MIQSSDPHTELSLVIAIADESRDFCSIDLITFERRKGWNEWSKAAEKEDVPGYEIQYHDPKAGVTYLYWHCCPIDPGKYLKAGMDNIVGGFKTPCCHP